MRFIVYGAGAVGGVVGGRFHQHGFEVVFIARGPHHDAIKNDGLRLESPTDTVTLDVPVADHPSRIEFRPDDVVLLTMKTQDTAAALEALADTAHPDIPVVCVQNGVENERLALRWFNHVHGVCVMCPATHLEAGVVQAYATPLTGIMDVGRAPSGIDDVARDVAAAFEASTFSSVARPDIMRWKYGKLLLNLGNALEALCGREARGSDLAHRAREEGVAVLTAAGIAFASVEEDAVRRGALMRMRPIDGRRREGGSTWQSLARGTRSAETDYLNGEIVLLGRLHGVPTPVNALLQRETNALAKAGGRPGSRAPRDLVPSDG